MQRAEAMHALLFGMKRAYQASLRITRPLLRAVGLTPARFDMLFALYTDWPDDEAWRDQASIRQSRLCAILGVSRMTVSRMVRALEALGLVSRRPRNAGGRALMVELTKRGVARMRNVIADLIHSGAVELAIDSVVEPARWFEWHTCLETKEEYQWHLQRVRHECGDAARLVYPWHPDD